MGEQATAPSAVESGVWKEVALLLLGAAADHAVHCGDGEADAFRKLVRDSIKKLESATEPAQILIEAGGVSQAIARYSLQTQERVDALLSGDRRADFDSCTGLPTRVEAEAALAHAVGHDAGKGVKPYAAVFYLHRIELTNARFGEAIVNQVVFFGSQHVAGMVTGANDQLFRWSGSAFLAVVEREDSLVEVNAEIQRLVAAPFSRFFETPARSVYLPVKITAEVVPLFDTSYAEAVGRVEHFILRASGQGVAE